MDTNQISIATITLARNAEEESLLKDSLQYLAQLQIPVYICDGGSGEPFLDFLRSIPHFTLLPEPAKGVFAQARNSVRAAYNSATGFIFYTEPDKKDFFKNSLSALTKQIIVTEQTGVVFASRSKDAFETFPLFQQATETMINKCCSEITGHAVDHTYGPFLMNRKLAPFLKILQQDVGWGWRPFIFGLAKRANYLLQHYEGDFNCPLNQRSDNPNERIYRMRQLSQNVNGIVLSTTADISNM